MPTKGVTNMKSDREKPLATSADRFIGIREAEEISGFSRSSIKRKIKAGDFPAPVIAVGLTVRGDYAEVMQWRDKQFAKRAVRLALSQKKRMA